MRHSLLLTFAAAFLLSACTTATLEELRHTEPKGNPFQTALAKQYLAFADAEAKAYDWMSMKIFSEKGLTATYGNDPAPEQVKDWTLKKEKAIELEAARADLMEVLTASNKSAKPEASATAQYTFDCWIEQEHEGWQVDDIEGCRNRFFAAMNELKGDVSSEMQPSSYLVLFDFGSAKLNARGVSVIKQVADDVRDDTSELVLNGHTDRVGSEQSNMSLAEKRVEAVGALLIKHGIHQTRIREFSFGESDPAIQTADGVANKKNRRVEIVIGE